MWHCLQVAKTFKYHYRYMSTWPWYILHLLKTGVKYRLSFLRKTDVDWYREYQAKRVRKKRQVEKKKQQTGNNILSPCQGYIREQVHSISVLLDVVLPVLGEIVEHLQRVRVDINAISVCPGLHSNENHPGVQLLLVYLRAETGQAQE